MKLEGKEDKAEALIDDQASKDPMTEDPVHEKVVEDVQEDETDNAA